MITEREVANAIEECMKDPITGSKRGILADLIIIQDYLFGGSPSTRTVTQEVPACPAAPVEQTVIQEIVETSCDSDFLKAIDGRKADRVWRLMDELVEAVKILHPRMYNTFLDKVQDL